MSINIGLDLTSLYGRKKTGIENYAISLYEVLREISYLEIYPIFRIKNEIINDNNTIIINKKSRFLAEQLYLPFLINKYKFDFILYPAFPPALMTYKLKRKTKNHGTIISFQPDPEIFKEGTDIYFARQLINERLAQARAQLPAGLEPTPGPIATGLGEIFMYTVSSAPGAEHDPMHLREVQDWIIRPQLRQTPGVVEINTVGGFKKQFLVAPSPEKLLAYGLSFDDLVAALEANNTNVGAGYIERSGAQYLVRSPGQATGLEDLAGIVVGWRAGVPVYVRDVARSEERRVGKECRSRWSPDH